MKLIIVFPYQVNTETTTIYLIFCLSLFVILNGLSEKETSIANFVKARTVVKHQMGI